MNKENLEKIFSDDLGSSYFPLLAEEYLKDKDYARAKKVCNVGLLLNPNNNDGKFNNNDDERNKSGKKTKLPPKKVGG